MPISELSDAVFASQVLQAAKPVLVEFTAEWCGPCKQLAPILDQLSAEFEPQMSVGLLDVDQNQNVTMQYGVMGLPTLILFKNGQPVERLQGFAPKTKIIDKIKRHLGN